MGTKSVLLLCCLGAVLLTLAVLLLQSEETSTGLIALFDSDRGARSPGGQPDAAHRELVQDDAWELSEDEGGPPGRRYIPRVGTATLIGRVVDEDGRPRESATVEVARSRGRWTSEVTSLAEQRSDSDGAFRLKGLEAGEAYMLRATQAGCTPTVLKPNEPRAGETVNLGDLVLKTACRLSGQVVDPAGNPIAGAAVKLVYARDRSMRLRPESTTGGDGRFLLEGLPAGPIWIEAQASGLLLSGGPMPFPVPNRVELDLLPGEPREGLVLVMKPAGSIAGRIVEIDGALLQTESFYVSARAQRSGSFFGEVAHDVTDDGRFEIPGLDPDRIYQLLLLGQSGRTRTAAEIYCGREEVVFELPRLPVIQIEVRSAIDGSALLPGPIRLLRAGEVVDNDINWARRAGLDEQPTERIMLPYEGPGSYEISINHPGYERFHYGPVVLDGKSDHGPVMALLRELPVDEQTITGIVRRADNLEPLSGVKVLLESRRVAQRSTLSRVHGVQVSGPTSSRGGPTTRTDQQGRFWFSLRGRTQDRALRLKDPLYASERLFVSGSSQAQNLELLAHEHGAVEGHVRQMDSGDGSHLPIVAHRKEAGPRTTWTDGRGRYRIADLLPGPWSITVGNLYAQDRQWFRVDDQAQFSDSSQEMGVSTLIPEGRFVTTDIDLRQLGAALKGTVKINGRPRISHKVLLWPARAEPKDSRGAHEAWTGSSGGYGFLAVPPGKYRVTVQSDKGSAVLAETVLSLARGHTLRHDFDIRLGRLEVTLLAHESGRPIADARVTARRIPRPDLQQPGSTPISSVTDVDGLAVLEDLTADEFSVVIRTDRGVLWRKLRIGTGATGRLTVHARTSTVLHIRLNNPDIFKTRTLSLFFRSEGHTLFGLPVVTPLASATVTLPDIQPGTYELEASTMPRGWAARVNIEVLPTAENSISLTLEQVDPEEDQR